MKKINKTDTLRKILEKRMFSVDYFQREYRWGRKQIEQMLDDLQNCFEEYYDPNHDLSEVSSYGFYYMGCIICTEEDVCKVIDGQQRLTSLTLLLMYLNNLQEKNNVPADLRADLSAMIYSSYMGKKRFNINVPERDACMQALYTGDTSFVADNESSQNMLNRYADIENLFPDELKGVALPYFVWWLIEKVLLLEIDTPSEDEAHTIFLTMNDRGLSLNSAEMMKAFIIQQVAEDDRIDVNHQWQTNINMIKNTSSDDTSGIVNTEDVEFISMWLRAKYAKTMRDTKRGAKDKDFELLGEKFHTWVRNNARNQMDLIKPRDYKEFVQVEMTRVTNLYLRIQKYSRNLTDGFEEVFYNANRDLNYQLMLIISAIKNEDSSEIIDTKIKMISKFVDDFATIRIFNYKKVNWNTNKYILFKVLCDIRNQDVKTIGMVLVKALRRMGVHLSGIREFSLNQFTGRYMLHILARFTSFINEKMGNPSEFERYVNRKQKGNTFDIEHILPNKFDDYKDNFESISEFNDTRQMLGNLILLTRDHNRSYQDMKYSDKVINYTKDNILAQSLNAVTYQKNPHFLPLATQYGFTPISEFDKNAIAKRADIYLSIAGDIWNPNDIKELAGGWSDEEEKEFFKDTKIQEFTVCYAERSWKDALKYGFLSANQSHSGKTLYNVHVGDIVHCHITGHGFVGIGKCISSAVAMKDFKITYSGEKKSISDVPWINEKAKNKLDLDKELFIGVEWIKFVDDEEQGYWEKGLVSVPLVAYMLSDETTHRKVQEHFGYSVEN